MLIPFMLLTLLFMSLCPVVLLTLSCWYLSCCWHCCCCCWYFKCWWVLLRCCSAWSRQVHCVWWSEDLGQAGKKTGQCVCECLGYFLFYFLFFYVCMCEFCPQCHNCDSTMWFNQPLVTKHVDNMWYHHFFFSTTFWPVSWHRLDHTLSVTKNK